MKLRVLVDQNGKLVAMHQIAPADSDVAEMVPQHGQQVHEIETNSDIDRHIAANFSDLHQSMRIKIEAGRPVFEIAKP